MPLKPDRLPVEKSFESDGRILSAKALKMAKQMDPVDLCRFLKRLEKLEAEGVSWEEIFDMTKVIRRVISDRVLKMAKQMGPEDLWNFLDRFQELDPEGVGRDVILEAVNTVRRLINKLSGVVDLSDRQKPAESSVTNGELAMVLQFPTRPKPEPKPPRAKKAPQRPRRHLRLVK